MVTDTNFRKSTLRNLFSKKVVPGTFKHWLYHKDLLVFCLKFRFLPVCEYLNYYYNITNDYYNICIYIYMSMYIYIYISIYLDISIYLSIYIYIYIYYIYKYIYIKWMRIGYRKPECSADGAHVFYCFLKKPESIKI